MYWFRSEKLPSLPTRGPAKPLAVQLLIGRQEATKKQTEKISNSLAYIRSTTTTTAVLPLYTTAVVLNPCVPPCVAEAKILSRRTRKRLPVFRQGRIQLSFLGWYHRFLFRTRTTDLTTLQLDVFEAAGNIYEYEQGIESTCSACTR